MPITLVGREFVGIRSVSDVEDAAHDLYERFHDQALADKSIDVDYHDRTFPGLPARQYSVSVQLQGVNAEKMAEELLAEFPWLIRFAAR